MEAKINTVIGSFLVDKSERIRFYTPEQELTFGLTVTNGKSLTREDLDNLISTLSFLRKNLKKLEEDASFK